MTAPRRIRVRLVLDEGNRPWIIGKYADRLLSNLAEFGVEADIGEEPLADADVNHWMIYHYPWVYYEKRPWPARGVATMLITHVDDPLKLRMLREMLDRGMRAGICLSRMTVDDLAEQGVERKKLCFVTPGHDGAVIARRIVIGLTTRLYPDGRKREALLLEMAEVMRLDDFTFKIFGKGWEAVIPRLEAAGGQVEYHPETSDFQRDYRETLEQIPSFDFYLYLGMDEGSMGILDALAAGVATIVTPQGFHLDLPDGVTHSVTSGADLQRVLRSIAAERQRRVKSVSGLTWREYARLHAQLWRALVEDRDAAPYEILATIASGYATPAPARTRLTAMRADLAFLVNARSSYFRPDYARRKLPPPGVGRRSDKAFAKISEWVILLGLLPGTFRMLLSHLRRPERRT